MSITERDVIEYRQSGSWRKLEQLAASIVAEAEVRAGGSSHPLLGGGTRLMLALNHRISDDIDLFIRDPQWIGYLSPRLNSRLESLIPDYEEAASSLKLRLPEGEIDFIVAMSLLDLPEEKTPDTCFALEPVGEVLAKKLFYRGWALTPRDLFDWWSIETKCPAAVPEQRIAALLMKKHLVIDTALTAMLESSRAADLWEAVRAPNRPDFRQTALWARHRLGEYRSMAG